MVICLDQGADLHMAQLMPLPLTVHCFSKIQIGFTSLVPAHPGSPGKRAVKQVCVCVCTVVVVAVLILVVDFDYLYLLCTARLKTHSSKHTEVNMLPQSTSRNTAPIQPNRHKEIG